MHLRNNFHNKLLQKNPSILNPHFHSKSQIIWFITSKGVKEVRILGKDHLFQASWHTLILFLSEKTSFFSSENVSLDELFRMQLWYQSVFIFSALLTTTTLIYCYMVIILIRHGASRYFPQTSCVS